MKHKRNKPPTVGRQQELRGVLLGQPADLVDLLLDLQALQVVELGLVALEGAVNIVLAAVLGDTLVLQGPWAEEWDTNRFQKHTH